MKRLIDKLKSMCSAGGNTTVLYVEKQDVLSLLDYTQRLENLVAVQNVLIDQADLGVKCNHCPFTEDCILKEGNISDCQTKMAKRGTQLNHSI
jgi:hypothetical protein